MYARAQDTYTSNPTVTDSVGLVATLVSSSHPLYVDTLKAAFTTNDVRNVKLLNARSRPRSPRMDIASSRVHRGDLIGNSDHVLNYCAVTGSLAIIPSIEICFHAGTLCFSRQKERKILESSPNYNTSIKNDKHFFSEIFMHSILEFQKN